MRTVKIYLFVFASFFLISGSYINANTDTYGKAKEDCSSLLSTNDRAWSQLSAARVLNAMIRDRIILSQEFTDIVLAGTARELNVGEVYPGDHLHLNPKIADWVRERNWDKKTEELKRIGFFVIQVLKEKTNDYSNYDYLIDKEKQDQPSFDVLMNDVIQPMIVDTLELALAVRHDRLFSASDSIKVAGVNAVATGLMIAGTQVVLMGDVPSLTVMAAGGTICGTYLMFRDIYAHFKDWLARHRLAIYWKEITQQQCQAFDVSVVKITKA